MSENIPSLKAVLGQKGTLKLTTIRVRRTKEKLAKRDSIFISFPEDMLHLANIPNKGKIDLSLSDRLNIFQDDKGWKLITMGRSVSPKIRTTYKEGLPFTIPAETTIDIDPEFIEVSAGKISIAQCALKYEVEI